MTDEEHAKKIHSLTEELRQHVQEAAASGLEVEITADIRNRKVTLYATIRKRL